jgi:asparagine synthase (glutamine-hydrolysing)
MCGIIGIASLKIIDNKSWLTRGREMLLSRGPDQFGEEWFEGGRVGFGHRRLSIIDTSEKGRQPLFDIYKSNCIVFNGEIYNFKEIRSKLLSAGHQFHSGTDTEVILAAYKQWGVESFESLVGAFSFAIYDSHAKKIILARDRAGEKPLFIFKTPDSIRFSSEVKGFLSDSTICRELDEYALQEYFQYGYTSGKSCLLKGFQKLEPGHFAEFNLKSGDYMVSPYWMLPDVEQDISIKSNAEHILEIEKLLNKSVESQLISDVPVGVFLSGGLDSSVITSIASKYRKKIKTFHISFPGYGDLDESKYAQQIADHFHTDHMVLNGNIDLTSELPKIAKYFDEPIADSSILPTYIVSKLASAHCKVMLGGDGGDELFGGYSHYCELAKLKMAINGIPLPIRKILDYALRYISPIGYRGRAFGSRLALDYGLEDIRDAPFFHPSEINYLFKNKLNKLETQSKYINHSFRGNDLIGKRMRNDFQKYLREDILVKIDRCGMMNSLEVRSPFLDKNLVEYCFKNISTTNKVNSVQKKILFKKFAKKILPENFNFERKQGFSFPLDKMLLGGAYRDFSLDVLLRSNSYFDKKFIISLFKGLDSGRGNGSRIFMLTTFELWRTGNGL